MSSYQYIIEVTDKASGFISQFTKTLDKVNERFGSASIQGTQAFERIMGPANQVDKLSDNLGNKLSSMFNFGAEGEVATQATVMLDQKLGSLKLNVDAAMGKVASFSDTLLGSVGDHEKVVETLGNVSTAIDTAQSRFVEIGDTVGSLPFSEAVSSVMAGATDALDGVLPDAMKEQLGQITQGIETNLLPALNTFAEATGFNLDGLSPKIAEISGQFGNFLATNGPGIQSFIARGQGMVKFMGSARSAVIGLTGMWHKYKGVLTVTNLMTKIGTMRMVAQRIATAAFALVSGKLNIATKIMTVAQRALNLVLKANPIVLIISLLIAGGAALLAFARKSNKASEQTKKFNELQEQTNEIMSKGEDLRKRVNNVDNLNDRQKKGLRSELQNRQVEVEDQMAANQAQLGSVNIEAKRKKLAGLRFGSRSLFKEVKAYEALQKKNQTLAKELVENSAQQKIVNTSLGAPAADAMAESEGMEDGTVEIAGGGKKATNINVSLEKMIETLEVHAETLDESLSDVETKVKEVFLRILNSANYAAQ